MNSVKPIQKVQIQNTIHIPTISNHLSPSFTTSNPTKFEQQQPSMDYPLPSVPQSPEMFFPPQYSHLNHRHSYSPPYQNQIYNIYQNQNPNLNPNLYGFQQPYYPYNDNYRFYYIPINQNRYCCPNTIYSSYNNCQNICPYSFQSSCANFCNEPMNYCPL